MGKHAKIPLMVLTIFGLAACGGTGMERVAIAPPPQPETPAPPPTQSPQVVSFMTKPGDGNFSQLATGKLGEITYDVETKAYRVKIEDGQFYPVISTQDSPAWFRIYPEGAPEWGVSIRNETYPEEFDYTALISYQPADDHIYSLAFGHATSPGAMPRTGSANFRGAIVGEGTMPAPSGWGDAPFAPVRGSISFAVNFADGSLNGRLAPQVSCDCTGPSFGTYDFAAILTSNGFEGAFDLPNGPQNYINGVFTGPAAEEAMGLWSFPLITGEGSGGSTDWVRGAFAAMRNDN